MERKPKIAIAFSLIILVALFAFFDLHLGRDWVDNDVLLWNSREAYLFVGWPRSGYHLTCFQYLFAYIPAYFGVPHPYDDSRYSTIVIHIAPTTVERYAVRDINDGSFRVYIPLGDSIYAYDGGAVLWKWERTHFEKASPEEQRKVSIDENTLSEFEKDFTSVGGWSARHSLTSWPPNYKIEVGGVPLKFLVKLHDSGEELSLDIQNQGGPLQRILRMKRKLHLISGAEYERLFRKADRLDIGP